MNWLRIHAIVCALLGLHLPVTVQASPLEIYGFEGRGIAMANAMTSISNDYTAAFYNPALISQSQYVVAGAGWSMHIPRLGVRLERAPKNESDLPVYPDTRSAVTVGGLFPLGPRLGNRVGLAIASHLPVGPMLEGDLYSPSTPQFYRYQGRANKFVALVALGVKVTDWLSVGAGVQSLADLLGEVNLNLRLSDRQVSKQNALVKAPFKVAPTAGLVINPMKALRIAATWRDQIQLDFDIPSALEFDDAISLDLRLVGTTLFTPAKWAFGTSYFFDTIRTLFTIDAVWTRWSRAPDPSLNVSLDAGGRLLTGLGLDERLDAFGRAPVQLNFKDTVSMRTGVEIHALDWLRFRAGYGHEPSPAPQQVGAYNYLDPTSHRLSVGTGFRFKNSLATGRQTILLDLGYALTILENESVRKSSASIDPVGDFSVSGAIHFIALTFRHEI